MPMPDGGVLLADHLIPLATFCFAGATIPTALAEKPSPPGTPYREDRTRVAKRSWQRPQANRCITFSVEFQNDYRKLLARLDEDIESGQFGSTEPIQGVIFTTTHSLAPSRPRRLKEAPVNGPTAAI